MLRAGLGLVFLRRIELEMYGVCEEEIQTKVLMTFFCLYIV